MTNKRACSQLWKTLSLAMIALLLSGATAVAQRTNGRADGDEALLALKAELEEAGRDWVKKYRQADSDEARAELERNSPHRSFEPRFLALARNHAGQPAAMEAVQWLAETANPGQFFDEGLALVEQHHLNDQGIAKMCRVMVFRRSPRIERFLLAVAEKHPDRHVQGLAYLCLARYLKNLHDFAANREQNQDWLIKVQPMYGDDVIAWFRAADPAKLSARVGEICEKVVSEYGDVNDDEVATMLGSSPESRVKIDKRTRVWDLSLRSMNLSGEELPSRLEGYTELRNLDLSHNPLSVEALAHLHPLTKLESINLEHTGITDQGLQHLKQLPNLKQVHLYQGPGHRTTKDGRRKLREAIPGLRVRFITH